MSPIAQSIIELELLKSCILKNMDVDASARARSTSLLFLFFQNLILISKPEYFFEIGAFDAKFSCQAKKDIPECQFTAFEANPYNYDYWHESITNSGVNHIHTAIGSHIGKTLFNVQKEVRGKSVSSIRGNNSILRRTEEDISYEEIEVPLNSIDNIYKDVVFSTNSIAMWIDVEGYASEVLIGAKNNLCNTSMVFIEVEEISFWKDQKLAHEIVKIMLDFGFLPIARDFEYVDQYNIVFIKNELLKDSNIKKAIESYYSIIKSM
jgi:FkbM family methyltransferase